MSALLMNLTDADKQALLRLARATLERGLVGGAPPPPEAGAACGAALHAPGATFVTLTRRDDGSLRGCIGELEATQPLYVSVMRNAMQAATRDPRFPAASAAELPGLHIEISVLTPLRPVGSYAEIEPGRHGVLLTKQGRSAVFLPQVASEQGWDVPTTLDHLAQKAGLPPRGWRTGTTFQVFEAIVFGEPQA
jgi:AmmeMemoRadiSam system protein A